MSIIACSVDGCERKYYSKNFCKLHYTRYQRHGDPLVRKYKTGATPISSAPCVVDGCEKPSHSRKMCPMHYQRNRLRGDISDAGTQYPKGCTVADCSKAHYAHGLCSAHHTLKRRHGSELYRLQGEVRDGKKICSQCARDLPLSMYSRGAMSYCRTCAKKYVHARRALLASVESDDYRPSQIFERDNWTCQLCAMPVDESLSWPHRFSASVDHIIPLSKGGNDTLSNVQLAHLTCNISKGARVI